MSRRTGAWRAAERAVVPPGDDDVARERVHQVHKGAAGGGFAAAGFADQGKGFAYPDLEGDTLDRMHALDRSAQIPPTMSKRT